MAYESNMKKYRIKWLEDNLEKPIEEVGENSRLLLLYWLYYSVFGISMTTPVESWIEGAGIKCQRLGYDQLGKNLVKHACHESGHEKMMEADVHSLLSIWNDSFPDTIHPSEFNGLDILQSVKDYIDLHERNIDGDTPYGQIAIEYEIERIAVVLGPKLLSITEKVFPQLLVNSLSFMTHHVEIDSAHTVFNQSVIMDFTAAYPGSVDHLVRIGECALSAYSRFIVDCVCLAKTKLELRHCVVA